MATYLEANAHADFASMLRSAEDLDELLSAPGPAAISPAGWGNRLLDVRARYGPASYKDWAFDNWVIWFWLAAAYHEQGDYQGEADAVDSAKVRAYQVPEWQIPEFRAQVALGNMDRVRELAAKLNDGIAYFGGLELRAHGLERKDDAMLAESERLLRWFLDKSFDAANREWWRRVNSYGALAALGRADELVAMLDTLVRQQPPASIGGVDGTHLVDIKGMLGAAFARQGNLAAADSIDRELAAEDPSELRGLASLWRARIAAQLGRKEQAVSLLDQAFHEGTWFQPNAPVDGGFWHTDPDFEPLRDYPTYQRLIAPK